MCHGGLHRIILNYEPTYNSSSPSMKTIYLWRDVLGWLLFMNTKYPSFQTECFIRKKADVSTVILQSSSERSGSAVNFNASIYYRVQNSSRNVSFFSNKAFVSAKYGNALLWTTWSVFYHKKQKKLQFHQLQGFYNHCLSQLSSLIFKLLFYTERTCQFYLTQ